MPPDVDLKERAWQHRLWMLDRTTGLAASVFAAVGSPVWIAIDAVQQPERWMAYVPGRMVAILVSIAAGLYIHRSTGREQVNRGIWATFVATAVSIAITLPGAGDVYPFYVLGYSLVIWTPAALFAFDASIAVLFYASLFAIVATTHVLLPNHVSMADLIGAGSYLGTATGLAIVSSTVRQRMRKDVFESSWTLNERNLELAEERALSAAKTVFLERMSHELRTPLNAILGYTELIQETLEDVGYPDANHDLQRISEAGERLLDLLSNLLDLSAIESGVLPCHPAAFDLGEMVASTIESIRPAATDKGLVLAVDAPPTTVVHDPDQVRSILLVLLTNAVKFTEAGSIEVSISTNGGTTSVAIQDTGPGIAKSNLDRIFQSFEQVDGSSTRRHEGSGLGLTVARGLATNLGGHIDAASTEGQGSTFTLRIPTTCSREAS